MEMSVGGLEDILTFGLYVCGCVWFWHHTMCFVELYLQHTVGMVWLCPIFFFCDSMSVRGLSLMVDTSYS